ncbi:gluconate 2-dehydrogenase subunit 3 family protein [Shewanella electrodiphila]|uniref:Gluconate 2-dehydrogenase subunit 3 family protein n=1 Tax=Shewanella electrodiphila TaxID=934143 RepID=A0ABT0KRR8_9GAMM|nr:gluconate 2-dehydrogenase subunit 3 family protein [Shewanella electrodiphila]MCL1046040.1 gluconate 2-dehydrogenase subunit 3 family protein [Shewanella electrodiphila]
MNRRQFLVNLSVVLGCSVTSINSMVIAATSAFDSETMKTGFTEKQLECIKLISDIIIPHTDTPSASEADAHLYVDYYVHHFMTPDERIKFVGQFDNLLNANPSFLDLSASQQVNSIEILDGDMYQGSEQTTFYRKLKQLIVIGYYTSKIGATQALKFDPIPGPYQELKLSEVGRVWF